MANCATDYCEDPIGTHSKLPCDAIVKGGLPALLLFDCTPDDPTDAEEVNAMIEAGIAHLWAGIKSGIPASSPVEIDAVVSCGTSRVINETRTATLFDKNVSQSNVLFFNAAKKKSFAAALLYNCDTGMCFYVNPPVEVLVRGTVIVPDQNTDVIRFEGTLNWNDLNEPTLVTAPIGIFA